MASTSKTKGLRLTLGGAPDTPHRIFGIPGLYRGDSPTPVGGDGDELTLEQAKQFIADHNKRERERKDEWEAFEAAKEAAGERPNGPLPFEPQPAPVEIVDIKDSHVDTLREQAARDVAEARNATREFKPLNKREAAEHADEQAALHPDQPQED